MVDSFMPPGWYLRPETWPHWMPNTLWGGALSVSPLSPDLLSPQLSQIAGLPFSDPSMDQSAAAHELRPSPPLRLTSTPALVSEAAESTNKSTQRPLSEPDPLVTAPPQSSLANANFVATDLAPLVSDATEDPWLAAERYAQMGGRRGGRRVGRRELSPLEEIHSILYDNALRTLKELDPRHPELQGWQPEGWIPRQQHVNRLNREIARTIARIKAEGGLSDLEPHHTLPREFRRDHFNRLGIDIDDFILYIPRDLHRLKPDGWHTGPEHWNKIWKEFLRTNPLVTQRQIVEQLLKMLKELLD
jgi:hypothetical protein